jgi:CheY-like chemotaxis protein
MCDYRAELSIHQNARPQAGALRVLLVDDNADVAESLGVLLEMHGHRILTCLHPHEALKLAPAFEPDVCILDIGLPCMSGHDLARELRAAGLTRPTYIAVTGYGSDEARKASDAAGFAMHLTKPVDPEYLLEKLACIRAAALVPSSRAIDDLAPTNGWVESLRVAT